MQKKPKHRSKLRMTLGKQYFTLRRYVSWYRPRNRLAKNSSPHFFQYVVRKHQSLLMKNLKNEQQALQKNKVVNLSLAIQKINGLLLNPGETFSFWYRVGRPSQQKGYLPGMVLHNGQIKAEVGGGLCQLSNLIHWLTLHTDLTITERWRHNYDVFPDENRTVPFGSGATVAYNYVDLQIQNNTPHPYQLKLWISEKHLEGAWLSDAPQLYQYQVFEKDPRIETEPWGGYTRHNKLFRQKYFENQAIGQPELLCENNAFMMYQPLLQSQPL